MENNKYLYEPFYKMTNVVDLMYVDYEEKMEREEQEKERAEHDAPSTPFE